MLCRLCRRRLSSKSLQSNALLLTRASSSSSSSPPPLSSTRPSKPTPAQWLYTPSHTSSFIDTTPPSPRVLRASARFYESSSHKLEFVTDKLSTFVPDSEVPEIAFLGRSNCGKSSLLNTLLTASFSPAKTPKGSKKDGTGGSGRLAAQRAGDLAFTSRHAGRTTTLSCFSIKGRLSKDLTGNKSQQPVEIRIVDTPGYGTSARESWGEMVTSYLQSRRQLRRAYVLMDASTVSEKKEADLLMLRWLKDVGIPHQIVLTKADKLLVKPPRTSSSSSSSSNSLASTSTTALDEQTQIETSLVKLRAALADAVEMQGQGGLGEVLAVSSQTDDPRTSRIGIPSLMWSVLVACGYV